jgi:enoyl-CoA hydratase/carnithine racemase
VVVLGGRGPSFTAGADLAEPPRADGAPGDGATARQRRWWSQLGRRAVAAVADSEVGPSPSGRT